MALMRMKQIREMSDKDMAEKMREFKLELAKERASSEIGTVKNPGRIGELRRTIARMNTVLAEKARKAGAKPAEGEGGKGMAKEKSKEKAVPKTAEKSVTKEEKKPK